MRPALRKILPFILIPLLIALILIMVAGSAHNRTAASDITTTMIILALGSAAVLAMAAILYGSLRLVKGFLDSSSSLLDTLRALTPMPVVTISPEIPEDQDGRLVVRIRGFSSVPFGQVTVILTPPPGLTLGTDHITLPCLDPDETKIIWISHGPAPKGKHVVGITILYRTGTRENVREFTRVVYAGIPAEPETPD